MSNTPRLEAGEPNKFEPDIPTPDAITYNPHAGHTHHGSDFVPPARPK
jgi:hypothetical protein